MQTVRLLFCVVWVVGMGSGFIAGNGVVGCALPKGVSPREGERDRVLNVARAEIGVKEATGRNDGKRVEEYLSYTGLPKGHPWCASFVSFCFGQAGYTQPRTAWSPALFPKDKVKIATSRNALRNGKKWWDDKRGLVFGTNSG